MPAKRSKLQLILDQALDGDQAAIDLLNITPVEVAYNHTHPLTLAGLKKDYLQMAQMYKAANLLHVGCLEMVASRALRYISLLAREKFDHTFTVEETTVAVVPLLTAMERVAGDLPLTTLETEVDDSPEEEEEEPQPTKKKTKKFELKIAKRNRKDSSSSSSSSSEDTSDGEGEEPPQKKRPSAKRKHHTNVKCPFKRCEFNGTDIKRHLALIHVKARKEVEEEDIPRLAAIFKAGKATRGPSTLSGKKTKLGKIKKWCPVPGCFFITPGIHNHIKYKHRAKKDSGVPRPPSKRQALQRTNCRSQPCHQQELGQPT